MPENCPTENLAIKMIMDRSEWYGKRAKGTQRAYILLKTSQIIMAAAIPASAALVADPGIHKYVSAILGTLIGIIEGVLQLGHYHENWISYRATREALKREELLLQGKAGPYASNEFPERAFIERSDAIMAGESANWLSWQKADRNTTPQQRPDANEVQVGS